MTSETHHSLPHFRLHASWLTVARDVAMVLVCLALVATFVADLWRSTPNEALRAAAPAGRVVSLA